MVHRTMDPNPSWTQTRIMNYRHLSVREYMFWLRMVHRCKITCQKFGDSQYEPLLEPNRLFEIVPGQQGSAAHEISNHWISPRPCIICFKQFETPVSSSYVTVKSTAILIKLIWALPIIWHDRELPFSTTVKSQTEVQNKLEFRWITW